VSWAFLVLATWLVPGTGTAPTPATPPGRAIADQVARLAGHTVEIAADGLSYRIVDVAGEGAPRVGRVERRGDGLWLREADGDSHRLVGRLAVPRIAGPGYLVWVLGTVAADGALDARRLGVLARPD
jgi:hypothetical protein